MNSIRQKKQAFITCCQCHGLFLGERRQPQEQNSAHMGTSETELDLFQRGTTLMYMNVITTRVHRRVVAMHTTQSYSRYFISFLNLCIQPHRTALHICKCTLPGRIVSPSGVATSPCKVFRTQVARLFDGASNHTAVRREHWPSTKNREPPKICVI